MEIYKFIEQLFHFHPELVILGAVTLIQIAPIKIDPWTALAKWFKKIIVGDIEIKLNDISDKVGIMDVNIKESEAKTARRNILRFADNLYNRQSKHSKEYFDDILAMIDFYERYCEEHKNFSNGRTVYAVRHIKKVYKELYEDRNFL